METDVRAKTEVWFVGRVGITKEVVVAKGEDGIVVETEILMSQYHVQGIAVGGDSAESERIAVSMCRDESYFIGPFPVNVAFPHERCEWPGMYFPLKNNDTKSSTE